MKDSTYLKIINAVTEMTRIDQNPLSKFYLQIQGEYYRATSYRSDRIQLAGKTGCYHVDILDQTCSCQKSSNAAIKPCPHLRALNRHILRIDKLEGELSAKPAAIQALVSDDQLVRVYDRAVQAAFEEVRIC